MMGSGSTGTARPALGGGWWWVASALALLSACASSPPVAFYVLSPLPEAQARAQTLREGDLSLGIGPLSLPDFLDRPQLVNASGPNRLELDEYQRWGGSLRTDLLNVLAENLAHLLGTSRVQILPAEVPLPVDYRLILDVTRFGIDGEGQAHLKVRWTLVRPGADAALVQRESSYRRSLVERDTAARVAALSATLGEFSREVAETLGGLPRSGVSRP